MMEFLLKKQAEMISKLPDKLRLAIREEIEIRQKKDGKMPTKEYLLDKFKKNRTYMDAVGVSGMTIDDIGKLIDEVLTNG